MEEKSWKWKKDMVGIDDLEVGCLAPDRLVRTLDILSVDKGVCVCVSGVFLCFAFLCGVGACIWVDLDGIGGRERTWGDGYMWLWC